MLGVTLPRQFHKLSRINMVYIAIQHRFEKRTQKEQGLFCCDTYCAKCPNPMEFDDVLMPLGALNWAKPLPRSAR